MRLKRIITLLLVLSFTLTMFSACASAGNRPQAETTGYDTETSEMTDGNLSATEQPEDTTRDNTEQTDKPAETTFPGGYDEETYNKLKDALVVLDENKKAEIADKIKEFSGLGVRGWTDKSFSGWGVFVSCFGEFDNCTVIFFPVMGVTADIGYAKVADYEFVLSYRFYLFGYYNGNIRMLSEAYEKGYISKEEIALVHKRFVTIDSYC